MILRNYICKLPCENRFDFTCHFPPDPEFTFLELHESDWNTIFKMLQWIRQRTPFEIPFFNTWQTTRTKLIYFFSFLCCNFKFVGVIRGLRLSRRWRFMSSSSGLWCGTKKWRRITTRLEGIISIWRTSIAHIPAESRKTTSRMRSRTGIHFIKISGIRTGIIAILSRN